MADGAVLAVVMVVALSSLPLGCPHARRARRGDAHRPRRGDGCRAVLVLLLTKDEHHLFNEIPQRGNPTNIKKR